MYCGLLSLPQLGHIDHLGMWRGGGNCWGISQTHTENPEGISHDPPLVMYRWAAIIE